MVSRGQHEDAVMLYNLCADKCPEYIKLVDASVLHETCADGLVAKGDFDKAVKHYIEGNVDFLVVMKQFPTFVPTSLQDILLLGKVCFSYIMFTSS